MPDLRIDFFRGLALYMVVVDHIGGDPLGKFIYQAVGFSATLDSDAAVDRMPFMPEMARDAGRRYTVTRRADKICDTPHHRMPVFAGLGLLPPENFANSS